MAELPQVVTEPGLARPFYTGNTRTDTYVTDALRALGDVSIDASTPTGHTRFPVDVNYQHDTSGAMPSALPDNGSVVSFGRGGLPGDGDGSLQYRGQYGYDTLGERNDYDRLPAASQADEHGVFLPQPDATRFKSLNARKPPPSSNSPFGDDPSPISQGIGSPIQSQAGAGGRFATFPVKGKEPAGQVPEPLVSSRSSLSDVEQTFPKGDLEDATPKYDDIEGTLTLPPGPPPGAAPPAMPHASIYGGYDPSSYNSGPSFVPDNTVENEDDIQLPYMPSPRESPRRPLFGSRPLPVPRPWLSPGGEAESVQAPNGHSSPSTTEPDSFPDPVQTPLASTQEISITPTVVAQDPPPPVPVEDPDDERELNAAAAREVSRELDSLMYQPPAPIPRDASPQPLPPPTPATPPPIHRSPRSSIESVPPASSPVARGRGRVSGSPPVPRTSSDRPTPTNGPPGPLGSTPSSPTQRAQLPPPSIVLGRSSSPSTTGFSTPTPPFRTPPEFPPSLSPASSQRSLPQPQGLPFSPKPSSGARQGSGMISVAAFRRPVRTGTGPDSPITSSSQDTSPLSVRKRDLRGSNTLRMGGTSMGLPPGAQPREPSSSPQELNHEDEFDYISAYYSAGGDEPAAPPSYTESRSRSGSLR